MKSLRLVPPLLLALSACEPEFPPPPPPPPPIDQCQNLAAMTLAAYPQSVRVGGAATLTATGGSGRYTYALSTDSSGGAVSGDRYVAGASTGTDVVTAADDCGGTATTTLTVSALFAARPVLATIRPGTAYTVEVEGNFGTAIFAAQQTPLPSGGSISATGAYVAGPQEGTDLIAVRDSSTGDQVLLRYTVSNSARFRARPEKLALPTGSRSPLTTIDGTSAVTWTVTGAGTVEDGWYVAPATGVGTSQVKGVDRFTNEEVTVSVRLLTELQQVARPQGRRSDVASLVTGDFDGDGLQDVALGVPESDLAKPQGGAVLIYRGQPSGLSQSPSWIITGSSDTSQLGVLMAAGDLDGDGKDDLAVSEPGADIALANSGAVALYRFTESGPELMRPLLSGGRSAGGFGSALAIADVDNDGDNDLIVGSPNADLSGVGFTRRGVLDIFQLQKGQPIPDFSSIRLGGYDLATDGSLRSFSNVALGRSVAAADFNGDGRTDLAVLTSVNNSNLDSMPLARNQMAIQVHFGRNAMKRFEDQPDLFVIPINRADGAEGTWRLGVVPGAGGVKTMLLATADQTDSPNLSSTGGTTGGSNGGGALLFDLSAQQPMGTPGTTPPQLGRTQAFARLYGNQGNIQAGRGFAVGDVDADGAPDLVLGAPFATTVQMVNGMSVSLPLAGRLLVYRLAGLAAGAEKNAPDDVLDGANRADTMGSAVELWRINGGVSLVSFNGRATTARGDFTGRLDAFPGAGPLTGRTAQSSETPAALGATQFGAGVGVGALGGQLKAVVGIPGMSGPARDSSGNEVGAGQAALYSASAPTMPVVLAEGAATSYTHDGINAFGGRTVGSDVAMADFDGDGRVDALVSAPNFVQPTMAADGGTTVTEYALNKQACMPTTARTTGAALVHLGQADGTFKEGFRVWGEYDIPGCTPAGSTQCRRTNLARNGIAGGFDFDGDGRSDLALARTNGVEVFAGRAPDDMSLAKPSMVCDALFSLPGLAWPTYGPTGLGDLDGDGCDELGLRYNDNNTRWGVIVAWGFDPGGVRCGGRTSPSWVRVSGDSEQGLNNMRLGTAIARVGRVMGGTRDFVAVGADIFPYEGQPQATVLLFDIAELNALRPGTGERVVGALGDGLVPVPVVHRERSAGFGRALWGGVDVTGDGIPDLVVGASGANINGDGTGAVLVYAGGAVLAGPNHPMVTIVGDHRERANFGSVLALSPAAGGAPAALTVSAPTSYRSGTANGAAFLLPLDF